MTNKMNYSSYQLAIFNAIENGSTNIAINAVAGSGKTTTIVSACKRLQLPESKVKFLAFNKSIADELKVKLKGYAEVSTLHAFGFGVLRNVYSKGKKRVNVDSRKYINYIRQNVHNLSSVITNDTPAAKVYSFACNVSKLFDLARVNLVKSGELDKLNSLVDEHQINLLFDEINACSILLADAYKMSKDLVIDYTDMIVLPLLHKEYIPSYYFVFIDECQDLNAAQRELMLAAAKGGRFVAVGDRRQAINGFAGADCESFDKIAQLPNTIELPLSVNYRCGSNMINLAKEIVPEICAHDGAIEGNVEHVGKLTKELFQPNDMVLCRTSAPLVAMCMKLIQSGVTALVKGRDIAQGLKSLVENANTDSIDNLLDYMENEKAKLLAVIKKERKLDESDAKETARYRNLEDRCKCIEYICLNAIKSTKELNTYIDNLFTDDNVKNAVILSTAHKSKGLESDRVLILLPHKLPMTWRNQKEWQYQQEVNLRYVALTRAKKELVFVDIDEKDLVRQDLD